MAPLAAHGSTASPSLLSEGPFERGVPKARVPGQALVRLHGFDDDALMKLTADESLRARHARALDEIAARTGVRMSFLSRMYFGWALYDISRTTTPTVRPDEDETQRLIAALAGDKAVAGAGENGWRRELRVPNDEFYDEMWHLHVIGAEAAWDITTGTSSQRIGVIDSGTLRGHLDLSSKDIAGYDFISEPEIAFDGNGRDSDYSDPGTFGTCKADASWHGTHVAGTILAEGNDGYGIPGVNWNAKLVTARALGECGGSDFDVLHSIIWLSGYPVDGIPNLPGGAVSVINMSLGSEGSCPQPYQEVFDTIIAQKGVVFVAAAGNEGNHVPVGTPANCDGAIAVGAHGIGASRPMTTYSNFSSELDVIAPGGVAEHLLDPNGVLSTIGPNTNLYGFLHGTSMASPHVAGVVSLMLAANPTLSPAQVKSILIATGEPCSGCGGVPAVRADLAVQSARNTTGIGDGGGGDLGVGPCPPDGVCPGGQTCLGQTIETGRCYQDCTSSSQCGAGSQCINIDPSLSSCLPAGNLAEGASCASNPFGCKAGTQCLTSDSGSFCFARCDMGYRCASHQQCIQGDGFAYCDPIGGGNSGGGNNGGGNDDGGNNNGGDDDGNKGGGNSGGGDTCDLRRGNWDCSNRHGCVDDGDGDDFGICERGAEGRTGSGGLCEDNEDCSSGLCDRGVCTVPCDERGRCRDGYQCDEDVIPGGLCRAESCQASEGDICAAGWHCTYSSARRYVCAKEGEPAFGSRCACAGVPSGAPWGLLVGLLLLPGLVRLPRKRQSAMPRS